MGCGYMLTPSQSYPIVNEGTLMSSYASHLSILKDQYMCMLEGFPLTVSKLIRLKIKITTYQHETSHTLCELADPIQGLIVPGHILWM